jgi:hypothetical protein
MSGLEFRFLVTVKLAKASAGPRADPDYLGEEVRQAIEEAAEASVFSDEDVEYSASASAAIAP